MCVCVMCASTHVSVCVCELWANVCVCVCELWANVSVCVCELWANVCVFLHSCFLTGSVPSVSPHRETRGAGLHTGLCPEDSGRKVS